MSDDEAPELVNARVVEADEYDSEGFLINPRPVDTSHEDHQRLVEPDEYDSEGFLINPRSHHQEDDGEACDGSGKRKSTHVGGSTSTNPTLRAWSWKREHLSDEDRFHLPYNYPFGDAETSEAIPIKQLPFNAEGFASTVWDSSIVTSRYIEKHAAIFKGKRCLELGAGCGLVSIVLAKVGALVTATDLKCNLPLLQDNINSALKDSAPEVVVGALEWGKGMEGSFAPPYDFVFGCDIMYIREAVPSLVETLVQLSNETTKILFAYGRNRFAEEIFFDCITGKFTMLDVDDSDLDPNYCAMDVRLFHMQQVGAAT